MTKLQEAITLADEWFKENKVQDLTDPKIGVYIQLLNRQHQLDQMEQKTLF